VAEGKLRVTTNKALVLEYTSKKGKPVSAQIPQGELSADLEQLRRDFRTIQQLDGVEVEFDQEGSAVKRIRRKGQAFVPPSASSTRPQAASSARPMVGTSGSTGRQPQPTPGQTSKTSVQRAFHNPYNFIPAPPRKTNDPDLGDHEPVGHHRLFPDRYTGVIRVKMTAITPLLLPDAANATDIGNGHKSFPVRLDADGKPYIPPTSLKGMLRSAYEAITNSRLAVFPGHEDKLAYRMAVQEGLRLVPARVENGKIILLTGTSQIGPNGPDGPMYAAWLPRYAHGNIGPNAVSYPNGKLPEHGDQVDCWIELFQHYRWNRGQNRHVPDFQLWRVRHIVPRGQPLGPQPQPTPRANHQPQRSYYEPLNEFRRISGYVCITNPNIDRKHDERVFFTSQSNPPAVNITPQHREDWRMLITNYQQTHEKEITSGQQGPPALQHSVWSRQITGVNGDRARERTLEDGTLLYVAVGGGTHFTIEGLYPVNISRRLFEASPLSLLDASLRPATSITQLSPADRVFGWVNQEGKGAYRGHLRIGPVTCQTSPEDAIEWFNKQKRNLYGEEAKREPGLPLAILGQPKPQQARFYVAASPDGEAQKDGLDKEKAGYSSGKGLRGRKVYPHHKLPERYWDNPMVDRTQQAMDGKYFQEYRRPMLNGQEQRDDQNRSIQGWVKPGTEFTFDIHITNLSKVELGALLWLLSLPKEHYHRFGGGKPLGFGSIRLDIDWNSTRIYDGKTWKEIYSSLDEIFPEALTETLAQQAVIQAFKDAVVRAYGATKSFEAISFIAAFLRMAKGFDDGLPVHYPRGQQKPHPEGRAYEWFVANEKTQKNQVVNGYALPDLVNDLGLPLLESDAQGQQFQRG
jgi:CRISPR-associated protein (TIGR03986 family)